MNEKPIVITLCGSTRFREAFEKANRDLTLQGNIVISVGYFGHGDPNLTEDVKRALDELHFRKIDISDAIMVVSGIDGYIGNSTFNEIQYARSTGKQVLWMVPIAEENWRALAERKEAV
jgi:hypothetical protein